MRIRRRLLHWKPVIHAMRRLGLKVSYAQNREDLLIANYFNGFTGTLLSIGENDGRMFSNVLYFILRGWKADLVEPSAIAYDRLFKLHKAREGVYLHKIAIGTKSGYATLYDTGELLDMGDTSLVSSLNNAFTGQWNIPYKKTVVKVLTFEDFIQNSASYKKFSLISIDAETMDLDILEQIDLNKLDCKVLVIEHGGDEQVKKEMISYCFEFGFNSYKTNAENIIFFK